jgi:hypothetical protein
MGKIKLSFIAGFGPIVREAGASRKLYNQILGIGFKEEDGDYLHTEALKSAKTSLCGRSRKQHSRALVRIPSRSRPSCRSPSLHTHFSTNQKPARFRGGPQS